MSNHYLYITILEDGKIDMSASDGVFSYSATCHNNDEFLEYCDEKAEMWLNSPFGNFDGWSKDKRKTIANKWLDAKNLSKGKYEYYFNLNSKEDIFNKEVDNLAKSMGINNYTLTV